MVYISALFRFFSVMQLLAAYSYATGVDLNCGCPKSDVRAKGFGSFLLNRPDLLADIVKQCRARISDPDFTAEKAGVSHLTVHGRTPQMRSEPVDYDAIRLVKESVSVPVVANGDVTQKLQALEIAEKTGVDGDFLRVMAANGLLYNPALFAGFEYTPASCIRDFVRSYCWPFFQNFRKSLMVMGFLATPFC
ncbi:dihydrouridine synthase [Ancylostoma ceylanicum]|uniref:Dihydrouridine synthase n=1 Tax=Ancylostoma ceylanicum TaxID=53326 RepID=A0A0D6LIZ3_9BILA|nr:dihydrouridine synthase [Ancylostoma ceylanicum]